MATAIYTYTSGANIGVDELTGQTGPTRSFSYDSDGNMTGRGSDSFSWDGLGRLQSSTAGGTTVSYRYDPEGGLETRTSSSPSSTTNYLLGGSYETDGSGAITESYIDGPAGNLAQYDGPPPTSSSATLGTTTIGASTVGNNGAGVLDLAGPYTLSGSLTVSKLRGYLAASSSGNAKLRAVIYSDNSGQPGTLKAVSDEVTLTAGEAAAWVDLALPANVTLSAGSYWVGYWYGDNNAIRYYDAVAGAESYAHVDYSSSGDPPGTYIEEGTNDEKLSLYATGSSGSSSVHYLYYNGHGDLAAETSASGSRTAAYTYDPFGAPLEPPAANSTSHRYTAEWDKQYDSSSNLVLMGARPYDPDLGRFLAIDPVDGGSLNRYDYAGQDPISGYDLDGTMLQKQSDLQDDGHTIIDAGYSTTWQNVVKASAIAIGAVAAPEVVQGFSAALRAASVRVAIERQLRTDPEAGPSDLSNFGHSFRDAYNAVGPGATQWQKIQAAYLVAAEPFFSPVVRATIRVAMANMIRTVLRRGG